MEGNADGDLPLMPIFNANLEVTYGCLAFLLMFAIQAVIEYSDSGGNLEYDLHRSKETD